MKHTDRTRDWGYAAVHFALVFLILLGVAAVWDLTTSQTKRAELQRRVAAAIEKYEPARISQLYIESLNEFTTDKECLEESKREKREQGRPPLEDLSAFESPFSPSPLLDPQRRLKEVPQRGPLVCKSSLVAIALAGPKM